jgi:outer membrane protein TolC
MLRPRNNNGVLIFCTLIAAYFSCSTAFAQSVNTTAISSTSTVFAPALRLTLREVLEKAGAENVVVKEFQARYNLAISNEVRAQAWYLPTLSAGAGVYGASGTVMNARGEFFQNVTPNNASLAGGVAGEWRFADAVYATKAAELRALAAKEDIEIQRLRTLISAVTTYFDIASAQERMRLLGETYLLNERLYTQLALQQGAGLTYKSDVLLVQASLSRLKLLSQQAAAETYRRSAELSALLNLPRPHHIIVGDSALLPIRLNDTLLSETLLVDSLTQEALAARPELRGLENELAALREEATALTFGRLLPSVTLNLSTTLFGPVPLPQYGRAASVLGVGWSLPIADVLGRGQAQQVEAAYNLRKAQEDVVENQIAREIAMYAGALAVLRPALGFAREELSAAQEALRQSVERQKLGTAKPLEVLQAYDYVTRAQGDFVQVVSEYNKAEYGLFLARGRNVFPR